MFSVQELIMQTHDNNNRGHETRDANPRSLLFSGLGLLGIMIVTIILLVGVLKLLESRKARLATPPHVLAEGSQMPPAPRLQITPERDLASYYLKEDSLLHTYGWIAREAGIVRIPVDSAMVLLLKRGLPVRDVILEMKSENAGSQP